MNAPKILPKLTGLLAAACVTAAPGLVTPAAATTAFPTPVPANAEYVALGSSFASGPGVPSTLDPSCARSSGNYANLVATGLQLRLTDVTCGGATTLNLVSAPQTLLTGEQRAPQIDALTSTTDLVTITVGGNDVNYIGDLLRNSCSAPNSAPVPPLLQSLCTRPDTAATQQALSEVRGKLVSTVDAVRAVAPEARIVLVDYATVLPRNAKPCAALPLRGKQIRYSLDVARQLKRATKHAARQSGAELVKLSKASRGHDVCSAKPWVTGWEFGPDFMAGGTVPYHPNAAGMTAAADLIAKHLG